MKILNSLLGLTFAANTNPNKPNVLIILSDDQGYADVSWKSSKVKTPTLDKLRKQGMTIDGAYSQARCTPSRVALMTGKYPWKIGVGTSVFTMYGQDGIRTKETLLPKLMKNEGYDTHMYGKWHLGYCAEELLPTTRGFDTFHGFWASGGINYYTHQPSGSGGIKDYWRTNAAGNLVQRTSSIYSTDEFTNDFLTMLEGRQSEGKETPFFTWMAYNAPHAPWGAPDEAFLAENDNVNDRNNRKTYLAMVYRMDQQIDRILTKLEKTGELGNTIIIFQSDNGPNGGGSAFPLRGKKSAYSEGGVRVPSFIVGPNIPAGTTLHRTNFLHLIDWAPTVLDFAGADPTALGVNFDGKSFKNVFVNGADTPRNELFHFVNRNGAGIYRKGDYKIEFKSKANLFNEQEGGNHTIHSDGICDDGQLLDADSAYTYSDIFELGDTVAVTCLNTNCNREITMFNIRDDPYELVNIYDDNTNLGQQMIQDIDAQVDLMESAISSNGQPDAETQAHAQYPVNTGWSTYGWCDPSQI